MKIEGIHKSTTVCIYLAVDVYGARHKKIASVFSGAQ
jgi:hypothetical protein